MKRMVEFVKMLVYVLVAVVVYLGSIQVFVITNTINSKNIFNFDVFKEALAGGSDKNENNLLYANAIDQYLQNKQSPLAGQGAYYVETADKYNLPVYLMVAMAGAESGFGKFGYALDDTYNPVGLGIHEGRKYSSWQESIEDTGYVLRNYYFNEGRTDPVSIQNKWAPRCVDGNACNNSWADNVDFFISEMEVLEKEISSS